MGNYGLLHSFLTGQSILETVWLNLLTADTVAGAKIFPQGVGKTPWEEMPAGEDCPVARALKGSLMGRLVPLARFCLLEENGLHYTEGIVHPNYLEGVLDPSTAGDFSGTKPKMLWADPEKRPWRSLTSLLAFYRFKSDKPVLIAFIFRLVFPVCPNPASRISASGPEV